MTLALIRNRQVLEIFLKKMKFSPIVSIQGPRQSGKSFFAKTFIPKNLSKSKYITLDRKEDRVFANENPSTFIEQFTDCLLIIDEAQKAPDLFDELKFRIDQMRRPGQFVLLGSTEFSHETKIRESLTGRLSRIRLYPFNVAETLRLNLVKSKNPILFHDKSRSTRLELLRYLTNGGLPGIFNVKSSEEREGLVLDWINLTVERDIQQIKKYHLDSEEARLILEKISTLSEPSLSEIIFSTGLSRKKTTEYLDALLKLFVIFETRPFQGSTGKTLYYITDTGILNYLNATFERKLLTWFYLEIYSQISYRTGVNRPLYYYRTTKGGLVHLLYEIEPKKLLAIKLLPKESFDQRDFVIFKSIEKKYAKKYSIESILLSGITEKRKFENVTVFPWESII